MADSASDCYFETCLSVCHPNLEPEFSESRCRKPKCLNSARTFLDRWTYRRLDSRSRRTNLATVAELRTPRAAIADGSQGGRGLERPAASDRRSRYGDRQELRLFSTGDPVRHRKPARVPGATSGKDDGDDDEEPGRRRVLISTHTISLQEQLISKDIPLLNSVIPREFSAVLVKGRRNYLSLRRMNRAISKATSLLATDEQHSQLRAIKKWSQDTDGWITFKPADSPRFDCLGRGGQRHQQLSSQRLQAPQRVFLFPCPTTRDGCPVDDRQSRDAVQRHGTSPAGRGVAARLRRRHLGRKPHGRIGRRRSSWHSLSPAASSITCSIDFTTTERRRVCWSRKI